MYTAIKKMTSLCLRTISSVYMSNKPNSTGVISNKLSDLHLTSPVWRHTDPPRLMKRLPCEQSLQNNLLWKAVKGHPPKKKFNGMYKEVESFKLQNATAETILKYKWVTCVSSVVFNFL